tara:strand:- start:1235 stop:2995 length:1761 start_codon:yes stop_codon:yes gene_type:complete
MADAAESTKQMGELEAQLQSMAEAIGKLTKEQVILTSGTEKWRNQTGLLQKQKNKFRNMMSTGFVGALMKTHNTVKNLNKGMVEYEMQTEEGKKTLLNSMPAYSGFFVKMMQGTRIQRAMTDVTAGANAVFGDQSKIVNRVGMRVTRLATAVGGLFGFLIVAAIGIGLFVTAMDGANTPLLSATENMGILHSAVEGLVFALTGEGEGTFLDVIIAAVIIAAPLFLILGSTIAAVAAGAIIALGVFHTLRDAGVGMKTAVTIAISAFVVLTVTLLNLGAVGTALVGGAVTGIGATIAVFVVGVGSIIGGIALVVAGMSRAVTWWKSILMIALGAFLIFIGAIILGVSAPIAAIVAVVVFILALVVRFRVEIVAFFMGLFDFIVKWGVRLVVGVATFIGNLIGVILLPITVVIAVISGIVGGLIAGVVTMFTSFWNDVVRGAGSIPDRFRRWGKNIKDAVVGVFVDTFNWVVRKYNAFAEFMSFEIPEWVPLVGGKEFKLPIVPEIALAKGGIVKTPTRALIGEAGPEAVIPLNRMKEMGGLGTTINVNIDVSGVTDRSDKRALAREISDLIAQEMRRNGGAPTRGRF